MKIKFVSTIGPGGFGIVDKVKDEDGSVYARKTFQINNPGFPKELEGNAKQRFIREAKYQSNIIHKNIVPVIHSNLDADPPYYIMPLAESTLEKDIRKSKNLNGEFMNAIMDIIAGLEELHSMRVFHRDLKPPNVLRFPKEGKGSRDFYAISDFGLMAVNQTNITTLTKTGMRMGSDYYTAPEIVKDLKDASIQSDIYSLGCILHDFIGTEDRIPCHEIKETGEYAGILLNCTRMDKNRRFKSVEDVRDALISLGDVEPITRDGKGIFKFLEAEEEISLEDWKVIIDFIDDEIENEDGEAAIRKITLAQLKYLIENYKNQAERLGSIYAKWVRENSFIFEHCDGIANRLKRFINGCDLNIKVDCIMSLLYLGTKHNRFYVEKMFTELVGKDTELNLAKRVSLEIKVDDEEARSAIIHLKHSIGFNVEDFHPLILKAYREIK